jgi:hypothetical protein
MSGNFANPSSTDTLVFVDVDGVLNLGIQDPGGMVDFNDVNLKVVEDGAAMYRRADGIWTCPDEAMRQTVERLEATCQRALEPSEGANATYEKFLANSATGFSELLVGRLASLINEAGARGKIVLSSNWRMPRHENKVRKLEASLSRHLGKAFTFDTRTTLRRESGPADRLELIGDFIEKFCSSKAHDQKKSLKVLVLDDFVGNSLANVFIDGKNLVQCAGDAEIYLQRRCAVPAPVSVRVVHTYDSWTTSRPRRLHRLRAITETSGSCTCFPRWHRCASEWAY